MASQHIRKTLDYTQSLIDFFNKIAIYKNDLALYLIVFTGIVIKIRSSNNNLYVFGENVNDFSNCYEKQSVEEYIGDSFDEHECGCV